MRRGSHSERIVALLARWPGLDDDEIARRLQIAPRQTVNQVCRRLADRGALSRSYGPDGKIINTLRAAAPAAMADCPDERHFRPPPRQVPVRAQLPAGTSLLPPDFSRTLIVIPCSSSKGPGHGPPGQPDGIMSHLPAALADELLRARHAVKARTSFNEETLVPAWQRYDGLLYQRGREALERLEARGSHIVILSGGYGIVSAREPIGYYNTALTLSWWPNGLLQRVLIAYVKTHALRSVRAFAAASTGYGKLLRSITWRSEGIADALLLTPERASGGMSRVPGSLGEALSALETGDLSATWKSSYGLRLDVRAP